MLGLGMPELIIILVIVVIIFGAGKLPQIGSGIGKGISNFRKTIRGDDNEGSTDRPKVEKGGKSSSND